MRIGFYKNDAFVILSPEKDNRLLSIKTKGNSLLVGCWLNRRGRIFLPRLVYGDKNEPILAIFNNILVGDNITYNGEVVEMSIPMEGELRNTWQFRTFQLMEKDR